MSYVGELGYELHIQSSGKGITSIFETLYSAENVSLAGFEALNSMSLEKGHRQEQTNHRTGIYSTPFIKVNLTRYSVGSDKFEQKSLYLNYGCPRPGFNPSRAIKLLYRKNEKNDFP